MANSKSNTTGRGVSDIGRSLLSSAANAGACTKGLEAIRARMVERYNDIFVDKLGPSDRIDCESVKLKVGDMSVRPYH